MPAIARDPASESVEWGCYALVRGFGLEDPGDPLRALDPGPYFCDRRGTRWVDFDSVLASGIPKVVSERMRMAGHRAIKLQTYGLDRAKPPPPGQSYPLVHVPAMQDPGKGRNPPKSRLKQVWKCICKFMRDWPGVVVVVGGVTAREAGGFEDAQLCDVPGQPRISLKKNRMYDCFEAAVVNALYACCGVGAAMAVEGVCSEISESRAKLQAVEHILEKAKLKGIGMTADKDLNIKINEDRFEGVFQTIADMQSGVYIVRLREEKVCDHAVVVDATRRVIYDNAEDRAIRLTAENLKKCAGPRRKRPAVAQVRKIICY